MLRSIPILLDAEAMPSVFLSSAAAAASSVTVSADSEAERAREDCLSAVARERRELVSCACVEESASKRVAADEVGDSDWPTAE